MHRARTLLVFIALALPAFGYVPEWVLKSSVSITDVRRICVGDLNGDGRPDVVTRRNANYIHVILTQADGSLGPTSLVGSGTDVALADVNGDGKLDLIIADSSTKRLIVAPGNGDGTFGAQVVTSISIVPDELAVGDFNGDGRAEVLVRTASSPAFAIYAADSSLQFSSISTVPLAASVLKIVTGDLDGDGKSDVLVGYSSSTSLTAYYGRGDGTFEEGVPVIGPTSAIDDLTVADLDGDGRPDVVTCGYFANSVTVIRNIGGRTFAAPVSYDVHMFNNDTYPYAVLVFDATDDGKPDVVVASGNYSGVMTLAGKGDGTLLPPVLDRTFDEAPFPFVAADLTGDGRPDLIIGIGQYVQLMRTAPGEVIVSVAPQYPTLSSGQNESYTVGVRTVLGGVEGILTPYAAGTVTLLLDGTPIGTGTLARGAATIDGGPLPLGSHEVKASFPESADYHAAISAPATVNVVSDTTTVTLTNDHAGETVHYGTEFHLKADITSSIGGLLTGSAVLYDNGQPSNSGLGPASNFLWAPSPAPGTHAFFVSYEGDAAHPAARSNTVTQIVAKADVSVAFDFTEWSVNYGDRPTLTVTIFGIYGLHNITSAMGNIHVYEGQNLLVTASANSYSEKSTFTVPPLSVGTHDLRAVYDGDDNYNAGESPLLLYTVLAPSAPLPPKRRAVKH